GLFAHLEMLECRAHRESVEREEKEQREEKLALLECRARELRLQRDELREKLERLEKGGGAGKAGMAPDPTPRDVLEWRLRSLQALLQLFHLTGISGKLSRRGVCFTLSTAFGNSHLDSFHLELLLHPQLRIHRHSIPPFIPLERISREFLPRDLRRFLSVLSQHLNGYAGRKFQLEQLQEHFSDRIKGIPRQNSLCNLLTFEYGLSGKSRNFPLRARLLYRDPCRSLPTDVEVSCASDAPAWLADTAAAHSELFRLLPLHGAFQAFPTA
ncbi:CENPO protein, partial [Scytalopus superciliaris]|nr:CENPO protein [Scytalopus superciliaris]